MSASILGQLQLGYQWVWSRQRRADSVLLFAQPLPQAMLDGAHVLDVILQPWSARSPAMMLSLPPGQLLIDLLRHARTDGPAIVVPESALDDAASAAALDAAAARGVGLVWRGESADGSAPARPAATQRGIYCVSAQQAVRALNAGRADAAMPGAPDRPMSQPPLEAGQIYEGIGNLPLAALALDRMGAWGLAGWPVDDIAHQRRGRTIEPQLATVRRLIEAVDADASMERIEQLMLREPMLAWRFLRHANSLGHTRRQAIDSLHNGLMLLGLGKLQRWLQEQLALATEDRDLLPVRDALIVRTHLMEQLLDPGDEDELRREILLSGLLSQIDLFSGEPLSTAMQRVPLPERVISSVVSQQGPYAPYLRMATALEYPGMHAAKGLCTEYGLDLADVNRTLLRVLARARDYTEGG